jgi:hypothetical protein
MCAILLLPAMSMGLDREVVLRTSSGTVPEMQGHRTVFTENFDGVGVGEIPAGWDTVDLTSAPQTAHWHIDDFMVHSGDSCLWCGANIASWQHEPGYGNLWRQYLTLALDLSGVSSPCSLIFDHQYAMEYESPEAPFDTWDGCNVRVRTPGSGGWDVITPVGGYPYDAAYAFNLQDGDTLPCYSGVNLSWGEARFDLSAYVGDSVYVRFWVASDMYCSDEDYCDYDGAWYIDDLLVGTEGDTVFFTDCETGMPAEMTPEGFPAFVTGNFWFVIDAAHQPQPDGHPVFNSSPHSAYCGDTTSLFGDGTYTPADHSGYGLSNGLVTPSLNFSADETVLLTFYQRGKGDGAGGYGYVDVSTDGGLNWTEIEMQNFQPSGGAWEIHVLDLSIAAGFSDVKVRFRAGSGTAAYHYVYWYVDDVEISGSGSQCWAQVDDDNSTWYWGDFEPGEMGAVRLENCQNGPGLLYQARCLFYSPDTAATGDMAVRVFADDGGGLPGTEITTPETLTVNVEYFSKWMTIDLYDQDVSVDSGAWFWLAVEKLDAESVTVLMDTLQLFPNGNAIYSTGAWQSSPLSGDFMFRMLMDTSSASPYMCGDTNDDGTLTTADGFNLLNYFGSTGSISDLRTADLNGDCTLTTGDGFQLLNYFGSTGLLHCQYCWPGCTNCDP